MSIRFLSFPDKVTLNESALLESKSLEERKSIFQQWSLELLAAVETWSQSLEDGAFKTHGQCKHPNWSILLTTDAFHLRDLNEMEMPLFNVFPPVSLLTKQVLPLILKWEWGTTKNFLYQYQGEKTDLFSNNKN